MVGTVVGYLAKTLKEDKSIKSFFKDFTDSAVNWIRPLFLKEDGNPKEVLLKLLENPDSIARQSGIKSTLEIALEEDSKAMIHLKAIYDVLQSKVAQGQSIDIDNGKNINAGTITAGGNVTLGDTLIHQNHSGNGDNIGGDKILFTS